LEIKKLKEATAKLSEDVREAEESRLRVEQVQNDQIMSLTEEFKSCREVLELPDSAHSVSREVAQLNEQYKQEKQNRIYLENALAVQSTKGNEDYANLQIRVSELEAALQRIEPKISFMTLKAEDIALFLPAGGK